MTSTSTSRRRPPSATSPAGRPSRWMPCSPTAAATRTGSGSGPVRPPAVARRACRRGRPGRTTSSARGVRAGTSSARRSRSSASTPSFDVKGGGSDLVFPHHEMSAVQATALTGDEVFARHYVHQAMVGFEGEKMGKSKGNLVLVSKLRADGIDPMAIRLVLLAQHYHRVGLRPTCSTWRSPGWTAGARHSRSTTARTRSRPSPRCARRGRRPGHPGRGGRGRRVGRPHARGGVGRRRGTGAGVAHRRRGPRHPPLTPSPEPPGPTFPPHAGTFTFHREQFPREGEAPCGGGKAAVGSGTFDEVLRELPAAAGVEPRMTKQFSNVRTTGPSGTSGSATDPWPRPCRRRRPGQYAAS